MVLKAISLWALCFVIAILIWHTFLSGVRKLVGASRTTPPPVLKATAQTSLSKMIGELRFQHGPLWRRKTRLYLVIGEPEQIQAIAPHLSQDHWLHGEHNVLLWGGSVQAPLTPSVTELCQQLTRWRALDGVIWALTPAQSKEQQIL
ncbi:type VI secretion protein VasK, partial [Pseudomonas sp. MYb115]